MQIAIPVFHNFEAIGVYFGLLVFSVDLTAKLSILKPNHVINLLGRVADFLPSSINT